MINRFPLLETFEKEFLNRLDLLSVVSKEVLALRSLYGTALIISGIVAMAANGLTSIFANFILFPSGRDLVYQGMANFVRVFNTARIGFLGVLFYDYTAKLRHPLPGERLSRDVRPLLLA